jgi:hypothetical protein
MERVNIFYASLLSLLLLVCFPSGCSNHQSDSIQTATPKEHTLLEPPMAKPTANIYKAPILIKAKKSQSNIQPSLTDNILLLGDSRIEHWPLDLPTCKECSLEVKRKFHPDGPDTKLVLSDSDTGYQWGVYESSQKHAYLLSSKLYFDGQGKLNMADNNPQGMNKKTMLQTGKTYQLKNCNISPLWIENIKPLSAAYSDDQSKHKIQIFFECH